MTPPTQLESIMKPRSVALVGASADVQKTAGKPLHYLRKHGYEGKLYVVNPRVDSIDGVASYPSVGDLPETPDVGLVLVGPERATQSVRELAERGTPAAIVLASGYAEIGGVGVERQREMIEAAGAMRLLGPNSMGVVNVRDRVFLSPSGALELNELRTGSASLVSQSGGVLGSLLSRATAKGLGFSKLVAGGNEADLDLADFVEYLVEDETTSVIVLYLEALRQPERFRAAAERAAQVGKPIVAFKVGRSEQGAQSASSHTGAMAGSDEIYDALLAQCGVIRVATFSELLDVPLALSSGRMLRGKRLAVLTSTGGGATLVADACGVEGFETPPPDAETADALRKVLVGEGAVPDRNPIDVTLAGIRGDIFRSAIELLLKSPTYDGVVTIVGSSGIGQPDLVARPMIDSLAVTDKLLAVFATPYAPAVIQRLNSSGVPAFDQPEACATALAALYRQSQRASAAAEPEPTPSTVAAPAVRSGRLNEAESKQLFEQFGVPGVREAFVCSAEEAARVAEAMGGVVVLKVLSRDIVHKSDAGGVVTGVSAATAAAEYERLLATVRQNAPLASIEGVLVQEQISQGVEVILGCIRDPQLGPAILLGAGGIAAEVFGDKIIRLPPLTRADAREMIASLKVRVLLDGFRGQPRADQEALVEAIMAFSRMAFALKNSLLEAEINPLFVLPEGQGVRAADGYAAFRE